MLRIMAVLFGIGFIFVGVAGFLPVFFYNNLLFGIFEVDTMHNFFHIVSGVIAIMCATDYRSTVWFFRLFGILYGLIAIAGFVLHGDFGFLMMHMNLGDNLLHTAIAIAALYLGFSRKLSA